MAASTPDPPAWFVVPIMPGIVSDIIGMFFTGQHGTYAVVKTFVGHPLYNKYLAAGYQHFDTYQAAVDEANKLSKQAKAHTIAPIVPGEQPGAAQTSIPSAWGGILNFIGDLTNPHTWLRVAEFVVGGILITVGLNAILKQSTGIDVAGSAGKVVRKVPI